MRGRVLVWLASGAVAACVADNPIVNPDGGLDAAPIAADSGADAADSSAVCEAGAGDCLGNQPRTCIDGQWANAAPCTDDKPICSGGLCSVPPSCSGLTGPCGANAVSCCQALTLPGATFNRFNNASYPATVSSVRLNTFEVTVGRFRAFVNSGHGTVASAPAVGAGADPHVSGSGWQTAYDALLPPDTATLKTNVTDCASHPDAQYTDVYTPSSENKPMNCVTWAEAFAFCIWDGGRLPTMAELELATRGGTQQRTWPWGSSPTIDTAHAYYCNTDVNACPTPPGAGIPDVGLLTAGAGRYGHFDLYGSMREQTLDIYTPLPMPCSDCVQLDTTSAQTHGAIGGSYADGVNTFTSVYNVAPTTSTNPRTPANGVRCAYDL